jgi:hypothetical protein
MHAALGDNLPVKVSEFLDQPDILKHCWTSFSGGQRVLVVGDGGTCNVSQLLLHFFPPSMRFFATSYSGT